MTWRNLQEDVLMQFCDPAWVHANRTNELNVTVDRAGLLARVTDAGFVTRLRELVQTKREWTLSEIAGSLGVQDTGGQLTVIGRIIRALGWRPNTQRDRVWVQKPVLQSKLEAIDAEGLSTEAVCELIGLPFNAATAAQVGAILKALGWRPKLVTVAGRVAFVKGRRIDGRVRKSFWTKRT